MWLYNTTTLGQSEPGSNANEEVIYIHQGSKTGASPSDVFVSHPKHLVYSTAPANWTVR